MDHDRPVKTEKTAKSCPARFPAFWLAAALVLECLLLLLLLEGVVAWRALDTRILKDLLYYQACDLEVHRVSDEIPLHFELKPGAAAIMPGGRKVTVNSLGFRDPPRRAQKKAGVTRIVILGGSNTYGALVSDNETYPAFLERALNDRRPGKYEVWNAGVNAYVLRQNLAAARRLIRENSPDLLIFLLSNTGRRAFLYGQPFTRYFEEDPGLYRENLRFCWPASLDFLRRWRLFRAFVFAANRLSLALSGSGPGGYDWNKDEELRPAEVKEFLEFYEQNKEKTRMAFLTWPGGGPRAEFSTLGLPEIRLDLKLAPGHGREFRKIHPPPHVYAWYAREIEAELLRQRLIPDRYTPAVSARPAAPSARRLYKERSKALSDSAVAKRLGGDSAGAKALLLSALEINHYNFEALISLCSVLSAEKENERALAYCRRAAAAVYGSERNPRHGLRLLASEADLASYKLLLTLGREEEAEEALSGCVKRAPAGWTGLPAAKAALKRH